MLADGYAPDVFVDGPLVSALRDGSLLYVEEINRIPEETLNVLITVMSEAELHVPRLGRVVAAPGFRLVAAMNPFDAVGTARISSAVYDRTCRLLGGLPERRRRGRHRRAVGRPGRARARRDVDGRRWSSSSGAPAATPRCGSARRSAAPSTPPRWRRSLAELRGLPASSPSVGLDAALVALSGRVRLREGVTRTAEEIITELWGEVFGRRTEGRGQGKAGAPTGATSSPLVKEGAAADEAVAEASRRTASRRELARHQRFEQVSPEVGQLDEDGVRSA